MNLIVAIGITALMAAISMPLFKNYQSNLELNTAAKDIAASLRYAQQQTITEQNTHFVVFDDVLDSFTLFRYDGATTTIKIMSLPAGVSFSEISGFTENTVMFNPYGAVLEPGAVKLENADSKTKIINIKPSGYVELQQ